MNKEEISILNYLKQYLQDKIDDGYHKLFYGENDYDFKTIDAINAIEELQHQLEEKDKIIDEAIDYIKEHIQYYDDGEYSGYECKIDGLKLWEILERDKEVK